MVCSLNVWCVRRGYLSTDSPVRRQKCFLSALRKFQRFTGSLWAGTLSLGGVMREGRFCDHGNFPGTRLSGSRLSWPKLAKARSGLVPTFQRREKKLAVSFGSYNSPRLLVLPRSPGSHFQEMFCCNPSWHVGSWSHQRTDWGVGTSGWHPVDVNRVDVIALMWSRWNREIALTSRWCESRAWRFVDVNDLISCDVYAQPLSLWLFWRLIDQWPFQPLMDKRGKAVIPARIDPASEKLGITSLSAVVQWVSCTTMMKALFL